MYIFMLYQFQQSNAAILPSTLQQSVAHIMKVSLSYKARNLAFYT